MVLSKFTGDEKIILDENAWNGVVSRFSIICHSSNDVMNSVENFVYNYE